MNTLQGLRKTGHAVELINNDGVLIHRALVSSIRIRLII